jgi:hypothetical protein
MPTVAPITDPEPPEPATPADPAPTPKKRGPKTPAGKARSRMNALRHGLRSTRFGLLPEECPEEWRRHVLELRAGLAPEDGAERQLVDAMAAAAWKEVRADPLEAEVLADIPPRAEGRGHGSDLQVPEHRASLATALRYQAGAGSAFRRAWRTFLELRKAKAAGLVAPLAEAELAAAGLPGVIDPEHQKCTNEFCPVPPDDGADAPAAPVGVVVAPCPAAEDEGDAPGDEEEDDPDAWLAETPVVEADPAKEAERRRLLAAVEHAGLRRMMLKAPLTGVEQFHAIGDPDPTVYEAWFAKQPKPAFEPIALSDEDKAAIAHVTRHNPPWIRGEYLGFYREPVPRELFGQGTAAAPAPANDDAATPPTAPAERPLAALRARVARLLDRAAARLPEELDLAEAICALKWPKWPGYEGAVDLDLLRLAPRDVTIDAETLHWLGGHEIAKECRAVARPS